MKIGSWLEIDEAQVVIGVIGLGVCGVIGVWIWCYFNPSPNYPKPIPQPPVAPQLSADELEAKMAAEGVIHLKGNTWIKIGDKHVSPAERP